MPSLIRYLREYASPEPTGKVFVQEADYDRDQQHLPATVYRPAAGRGRSPGWVVLHGLTAPGRQHPSLRRFARSVAASGAVVFVPDIPEWRDLRIAPWVTAPTIVAATRALREIPGVATDHIGVFGFSFGATQALIAATNSEVARLISGVAAWGGYSDVERLFRFGLTGVHELDGCAYRAVPDPYGRWISAGQYLPVTPGYEDAVGVAAALRELALEAGRLGVYAGDPVLDPLKLRLRARLGAEHMDLFDVFAHQSGSAPRDDAVTRTLAIAIARSAIQAEPGLDPTEWLGRIRTPVLLAHGRDDRLIPFTETIRLSRAIPAAALRRCDVTALFAHSGGTPEGLGTIGKIREAARFASVMRSVLRMP